MTNLEISMKTLTALYTTEDCEIAVTAKSVEKLIRAVSKLTEVFGENQDPVKQDHEQVKEEVEEHKAHRHYKNRRNNTTPEEILLIRRTIFENPLCGLSEIGRKVGRSSTLVRSVAEGRAYVEDVTPNRGPHVISRENYTKWVKALNAKRTGFYKPNLPGAGADQK